MRADVCGGGRQGVVLQRDERGRSAEVPGHCVQDLHGVLQLQLLVQRHDAGLGPLVLDQDLTEDAVVELQEPGEHRENRVLSEHCLPKTEASHTK